jgi:hypothetical protein
MNTLVPEDYSGGDITIKLYFRSTTTNSSEATAYYIHCQGVGGVYSAWNIANNITTQTASFSTTLSELTLNTTIADANVDAGDIIQLAWRPTSALSGTVYLIAGMIVYNSNS